MAGKIFINYRRVLNLKDAQILERVLRRYFGQRNVFLDLSGVDGGDHWLHTLEKQVDGSIAMVALIGPGWVEASNERGERRLHNPHDFVRFEIARAFARNIPVLPVLVDGGAMPDPSHLPTNLLPLTFLQAMLLRTASLEDDGEKVARRLKHLISVSRSRGISPVLTGALALAALATGLTAGPSLWSLAGLSPPGLTDATQLETLRTALKKAESESREAGAQTGRAERTRQLAEAKLAETEPQLRALTAESQKQAEFAKRATADLAAERSRRESADRALADERRIRDARQKTDGQALDDAKRQAADLQKRVADLDGDVKQERDARNKAEADAKKQADLAAQLSRDLEASRADAAKVDVLNQQLLALRRQHSVSNDRADAKGKLKEDPRGPQVNATKQPAEEEVRGKALQREAAARNSELGAFYPPGLPKTDQELARFYKLAADQGQAAGQNNLGIFYRDGRGGLVKDEREAARLFRLAADQGNAFAQYNLGVFYRDGRGSLAKDEREAARLFKLAVDQGHDGARNALADLNPAPLSKTNPSKGQKEPAKKGLQ